MVEVLKWDTGIGKGLSTAVVEWLAAQAWWSPICPFSARRAPP